MARPPRKRTRLNAHRPAAPAALGWKFWAVLGRDETVVVEIPDRGFARSPIEQGVVRMTIAVKVRHINQVPVLAQRRTCSAPQVGVVIQIPNGSFVEVRTEHVIGMTITVKIITLGYVREFSFNFVRR